MTDVRCIPFGEEALALLNPEAMLLVDDGQSQRFEDDAVLEQRVRTDDELDEAFAQPRQKRPPLPRRHRAGGLGHDERVVN
jgi:hypothetical protein